MQNFLTPEAIMTTVNWNQVFSVNTYARLAAAAPIALSAAKSLVENSSTLKGFISKFAPLAGLPIVGEMPYATIGAKVLPITDLGIAASNAIKINGQEISPNRDMTAAQLSIIAGALLRVANVFINSPSLATCSTIAWTAGSFLTARELNASVRASTAQKTLPLIYGIAGAISLLGSRFATLRSPVVRQLAVIAPFAAAVFAKYTNTFDRSSQIRNPVLL